MLRTGKIVGIHLIFLKCRSILESYQFLHSQLLNVGGYICNNIQGKERRLRTRERGCLVLFFMEHLLHDIGASSERPSRYEVTYTW